MSRRMFNETYSLDDTGSPRAPRRSLNQSNSLRTLSQQSLNVTYGVDEDIVNLTYSVSEMNSGQWDPEFASTFRETSNEHSPSWHALPGARNNATYSVDGVHDEDDMTEYTINEHPSWGPGGAQVVGANPNATYSVHNSSGGSQDMTEYTINHSDSQPVVLQISPQHGHALNITYDVNGAGGGYRGDYPGVNQPDSPLTPTRHHRGGYRPGINQPDSPEDYYLGVNQPDSPLTPPQRHRGYYPGLNQPDSPITPPQQQNLNVTFDVGNNNQNVTFQIEPQRRRGINEPDSPLVPHGLLPQVNRTFQMSPHLSYQEESVESSAESRGLNLTFDMGNNQNVTFAISPGGSVGSSLGDSFGSSAFASSPYSSYSGFRTSSVDASVGAGGSGASPAAVNVTFMVPPNDFGANGPRTHSFAEEAINFTVDMGNNQNVTFSIGGNDSTQAQNMTRNIENSSADFDAPRFTSTPNYPCEPNETY